MTPGHQAVNTRPERRILRSPKRPCLPRYLTALHWYASRPSTSGGKRDSNPQHQAQRGCEQEVRGRCRLPCQAGPLRPTHPTGQPLAARSDAATWRYATGRDRVPGRSGGDGIRERPRWWVPPGATVGATARCAITMRPRVSARAGILCRWPRLMLPYGRRTAVGSGSDGEESPGGGDALEFVFAAVVKGCARAGDEIDDGP